MTNASMINGKAYEYACVLAFEKEVAPIRQVLVLENSSLTVARSSWNSVSQEKKEELFISATAGIKALIKLEPKIIEDGNDSLEVSLQADGEGIKGDVRDVLIIRKSIDWEIGISVKHNHYAVKHPRLSEKIDFGDKWLESPCSEKYFDDIRPYFTELKELRRQGKMWRELPDVGNNYYIPILKAFKDELMRKYDELGSEIVVAMAQYLLGKHDYYKLISTKAKRSTRLISFNLNGSLNKPSNTKQPDIELPRVKLPERIISLDFKPNSNNTLELHMDNGWEMSLRIHSASSRVEGSLKFDVQFEGMPTSLYIIDSPW